MGDWPKGGICSQRRPPGDLCSGCYRLAFIWSLADLLNADLLDSPVLRRGKHMLVGLAFSFGRLIDRLQFVRLRGT